MSKPEVDSPPETGHAIPQWLRDQFDVIELQVRKMGAEAVFTQMRTKVQAYFEMLRSIESARAGRDLAIITQQKNLIASLREDIREAIAIDCDDDAIDACAEVERTGTPGSVIREMNDELVDLRRDAKRLHKATAFVQKLCDSAGKQPSVATGYLHDILSAMSKEG